MFDRGEHQNPLQNLALCDIIKVRGFCHFPREYMDNVVGIIFGRKKYTSLNLPPSLAIL